MERWLKPHQYSPTRTLPPPRSEHRNCYGCSHAQASSMKLVYAVLAILALGILILAINVYQLQILHKETRMPSNYNPVAEALGEEIPTEFEEFRAKAESNRTNPVVWIHGRNLQSGYLNHVFQVFRRLGYNYGDAHSSWDVLWAHDYPFSELQHILKNLKPNQKINHFPGSGFITNKVSLATSNITYIPTAFRIPQEKDSLFRYAQTHPNKVFVQKNNKHRGIKVEKLSSLNLTQEGSFVQEFIQNPFLIDERKFDIGVYTIITSIDPLRVYIYNGDALLRFCPLQYHPFDAEILDKYVVGDEYLPTWEMPSLRYYYETLGYTMKESLNAYLKSLGKNPSLIWNQIEDAIRQVILEKESKLITISSKYAYLRNFFEIMRFDFVLDDNLNIYIMEANMSPNFSSSHFPQNKLLYEQVIYNALSLLGLAHWLHTKASNNKSLDAGNMIVSVKDIMINADVCASQTCFHNCQSRLCHLCHPCLDEEWIQILSDSYTEHFFRHNCRRVFPPPMESSGDPIMSMKKMLNERNKLLLEWFRGKCLQDSAWCH